MMDMIRKITEVTETIEDKLNEKVNVVATMVNNRQKKLDT